MGFYNKLVLTNIGESTITEVLGSGRSLLLSELRLSADVYNQTEIKNLVSLSNTANIIETSSVILEKETDNFIISGSFSNIDITELLTINSIGLYSTLDNTTKLIGVATAIEPIIIKPFRNTVNFYNLKLSLALKQSGYNAIEIINGDYLDITALAPYVKKSEMTVEIADLNAQLDEKANLSYVEQAITDTVDAHIVKKDNPHAVTKAQVGLGSVDNVKQATKVEFDLHKGDTTKHISAAERTKWNNKQDNLNAGSNISISSGTISAIDTIYDDSTVQTHMNNKLNPHAITKTQVGLSNVSNVLQASKSEFDVHTEDTVKHITTSERSNWNSKQNTLGFTPENISNKGIAGGYASLNSAGKIPASELPSYVDDVVEGTTLANLPTTGETGKIYVTTGDNKTYRWSGTGYVEISSSLALGTTSSTAYRGDLGNVAYTHSQSSGNPHNTTKAHVGLGNVDNTSDTNKPVSTATQNALDLKADKSQVLTNVPANAKFTDTVYAHPSSHPASMITESSTKRFVSDAEKTTWNNKTDDSTVDTHIAKIDNPHNVTKSQIGLENVDNVKQASKIEFDAHVGDATHVTTTEKNKWNAKQDIIIAGTNLTKSGNTLNATDTKYNDATTLVSGLMSDTDKSKLDSIESGANNYVHPSSHPATIITETTSKRFVTDAEKNTWNAKQNALVAGSNVTISGNTINATNTNTTYDVATTTTNGLMAAVDKVKLNGIAANANNYTHPANHPASIITETSTKRFVTDDEKANWNSKTDDTAINTHSADTTKHITTAERDAWNAKQGNLIAGTNVTITDGAISAVDTVYDDSNVQSHIASKLNPHGVTKAQVGLGNVSNVAQASKAEFDAHNTDTVKHITTTERNAWNAKQNALGFTPENLSNKSKANGYASLDANGKVPASELPSYVDDVIEATTLANLPTTGETGKIYVTTSDNKTYRWSGTAYAEISASLALGTTSSTAYRGDLGNTAYSHSQATGNPHATTKAQIGLGNVDNTSDTNKPISTAMQTELDKKVNSSQVLTDVPASAKFTDTIYSHPSTHPASMITETSAKRFVTDAEKSTWNAKQNALTAGSNVTISGNTISAVNSTYGVATTSSNGLMASTDKTKLDGVANGAQVNRDIATKEEAETGNDNEKMMTPKLVREYLEYIRNWEGGLPSEWMNGFMSLHQVSKLNSIATGAQVNPTIATQAQAEAGTDNTRMVTPLRAKQAIQKLAPTPPLASTSANGLMSSSDKTKLNGIATGAQVNRTIATQVAAEAGTDNATDMTPLRTKQAIESLSPVQVIYDNSVTESTLPSYFEPGKTTITQNKISDDIWWDLGKGSGRAQLVITSVGPEGVASQIIISGRSIFTRVDNFGDNEWNLVTSPLTAANYYYDYFDDSALTSKQLKDYMNSTASSQYNSAIADMPSVSIVSNGLMASSDKTKLDGIATGANNYSHPSSHPASMITESSTKRFVTDAEKATWNGKTNDATANAHIANHFNPHAVTKSQVGLGSVSNYALATQAEAQAGTSNSKYMTPLRTKEAITSQTSALTTKTYVDGQISTISLTPGPKGDTGAAGTSVTLWTGTQAEYDALTKNLNTIYMVVD